MKRVPESVLQAWYKQALALQRAGDIDAAETRYRDILAQMPTSFHALHMLGVLCGQRGDRVQSFDLLARAIDIDPNVAAAHANLGNTLRLMERDADALACYDRALQLQPDNTRALKGRGHVLWRTGRDADALACYEHLLRVEPDYPDGWIMKAVTLDRLGRKEEAIENYRKALEFDNATSPDKVRYILASLGSAQVPAASPLDYVRDLFDKYARRFDSHLVGQLAYRGPERLVAQLRPFVPAQAMDVLDLGCGTGLCGVAIKHWARSLTGLDVSPKMLEQARAKQVYDSLVCSELTAYLDTRQAAFDLIVATDVFIYIGDLAPAFAGALRALRPGGLFAFTTEISDGAESELHESLRYAHSTSYLERLAAAGGWRVESTSAQVLREEERLDVTGQVTVLRRP
jgi:predicted TPR repeat methyltransferase